MSWLKKASSLLIPVLRLLRIDRRQDAPSIRIIDSCDVDVSDNVQLGDRTFLEARRTTNLKVARNVLLRRPRATLVGALSAVAAVVAAVVIKILLL